MMKVVIRISAGEQQRSCGGQVRSSAHVNLLVSSVSVFFLAQ